MECDGDLRFDGQFRKYLKKLFETMPSRKDTFLHGDRHFCTMFKELCIQSGIRNRLITKRSTVEGGSNRDDS